MKRIIYIGIAMMMLLCTFTGCGINSSVSNTSTQESNTSMIQSTEDESEPTVNNGIKHNDFSDYYDFMESTSLGKNDSEIRAIYNSVKAIYVDRSEAVHDGVTLNIARNSLDELRNILRRIYVEYVAYVQLELASNPAITFTEAKENIINLLIQQVTAKKQAGVLP